MPRPLGVFLIAMFICNAFPETLRAEWFPTIEESSEGTQCTLTTGSTYQETGAFVRDRSFITLTIQSYEPLAISLELDSGIQSSLRTVGVIKIEDAMYVLSFTGRTGVLKDPSERQALAESLRSGTRISAAYRNSERIIYDAFRIASVDKAVEELRRACPFRG